MNKFSSSIPIMLEQLNTITEHLEFEEFLNKLKIIEDCSVYILHYKDSLEIELKKIIDNSNNALKTLEVKTNNHINNICEKGFERIKNKEEKYLEFSKVVILTLFTFLMVLLFLFSKYHSKLSNMEKTIEKNNQEISLLHNILLENKKYWLDKDNYNIYIKSKEKKSNNK
ncbi:hypothetical protein FV113G1_12880 [Fusobacterium varium]|nr:hypothetical protein FV113G1_12880 [Fusobacterium varium]